MIRKVGRIIVLLMSLPYISVKADPTPVPKAAATPDSLHSVAADTTKVDSLSGETLEDKYKQFKESERYQPSVSFFDSAAAYYLSPRLNLRSQVTRSYMHDAGDYFRFDPSFLLLKDQVTPMRETVSPFGLNLGRLNYLVKGQQFRPFEQMPQPDGLSDMNDFPTALDDEIEIIPGPAGQLFGGSDAVASIVTMPVVPNDDEPRTSFVADAGSFGYSNTRGRYSRRFAGGRSLDMSIAYRDADGSDYARRDDSYQYYGDMFFPTSALTGIRATGYLYNRRGSIGVWQDFRGASVPRHRFDRTASIGYEISNADRTLRTIVGYEHARRGSYTDLSYKTRFNITSHGGYLRSEWVGDGSIWQLEARGRSREFDYGLGSDNRITANLSLRRASLGAGGRLAEYVGVQWVDSIGALPAASLSYFRDTEKSLMALSVGYTERAPTQNELLNPHDTVGTFFNVLYIDHGNDSLLRERQMIGSATWELGSLDDAIRFGVTGGHIQDAIYWNNTFTTQGIPRSEFAPINTNIDFADFSSDARFKLGNWFTFFGGGAYHLIRYEHTDYPPYTPDYDLFASGELHIFWKQKLVHFYAYGELVYTGLYYGYSGLAMGQEPVFNTKLSFRIQQFRFSYHFLNVLSNTYMSREYMLFPGRYTFYNVTWNFLD